MIADTDVLIDFLSDKEPGSSRVAEELQAGILYTTVINQFELLCGSQLGRQGEKIRQLIEALEVLELDKTSVEKAADIRRQLLAKGRDIGMADSLIAGIALEHKMSLLTRNEKHYNRVPGLRLTRLK